MALSVDDFADVQSALWEARSQWFNIGVRLRLKVNVLKAIDREQGLNLDDKLTKMILSWLECGKRCTWRAVRKALKNHTVNLPELAWQIKTKYGCDESSGESGDDCAVQDLSKNVTLKESATSTDFKECEESQEQQKVSNVHEDTVSPLPKNYQRTLHRKLYEDSQEMARCFSALANKTEDFLIKENISVERLVSCISPCSDDTSKSVLLIDDQLDTAQSVSRVFIILKRKRLISFINYKIIVPIINDLCKNEELTQELKTYEAHFREYMKRRVCETSVSKSGKFQPGKVPSPAEGDDLLIITDHSWSGTKPFGELLDLQVVVAKIFRINDFVLNLQSIESKCLRLHYYLSYGVGMVVFPLIPEQEDKLSKCGIAEVHYREHHHLFGKQVEDDSISREKDIFAMSRETHEELLPVKERDDVDPGVYLLEEESSTHTPHELILLKSPVHAMASPFHTSARPPVPAKSRAMNTSDVGATEDAWIVNPYRGAFNEVKDVSHLQALSNSAFQTDAFSDYSSSLGSPHSSSSSTTCSEHHSDTLVSELCGPMDSSTTFVDSFLSTTSTSGRNSSSTHLFHSGQEGGSSSIFRSYSTFETRMNFGPPPATAVPAITEPCPSFISSPSTVGERHGSTMPTVLSPASSGYTSITSSSGRSPSLSPYRVNTEPSGRSTSYSTQTLLSPAPSSSRDALSTIHSAEDSDIPKNKNFSAGSIGHMPFHMFKKVLDSPSLSKHERIEIKNIRRRGKSKMAAQNCRQRKQKLILGLQHDIDELKRMKRQLVNRSESLQREIDELRAVFGTSAQN